MDKFVGAVKHCFAFFSGGSPLDIALVYGVSHSEVFISTWKVVDAVQNTRRLNMQFPGCHKKQNEIARKFKAISEAKFDNCIGCIDGMLVWITKPNENEVSVSSIGPKKFYCGHTQKIRLNM